MYYNKHIIVISYNNDIFHCNKYFLIFLVKFWFDSSISVSKLSELQVILMKFLHILWFDKNCSVTKVVIPLRKEK